MSRLNLLVTLAIALPTLGTVVAPPLAAQQDGQKAAPTPELRKYQLQVRDKILEFWQPPDIDSDTRLQVLVRVDLDGKVSKREVKTIGDTPVSKAAEEAAISAISRAQPFPRIPSGVAPYYVEVRFGLKVAARTPATPKCYPVATYLDLPADRQVPVKSAITTLTGLLKDEIGDKELFALVSDRSKADLIIEESTGTNLPRIESDKIKFVGRYSVNDELTTGTIQLGFKTSTGTELTPEQISLNTMQLLGRTFGLVTDVNKGDSIMSDLRLAPRLTPDQSRAVGETVKSAACTPQTAQRGFKSADAK